MTDIHESTISAPAGTATGKGRPFTIASFICAAVALIFLPPILGIVGVILGVVGRARGDRSLATWAIVASVACAVIGMILGAIIFNAANDDALAMLAFVR